MEIERESSCLFLFFSSSFFNSLKVREIRGIYRRKMVVNDWILRFFRDPSRFSCFERFYRSLSTYNMNWVKIILTG